MSKKRMKDCAAGDAGGYDSDPWIGSVVHQCREIMPVPRRLGRLCVRLQSGVMALPNRSRNDVFVLSSTGIEMPICVVASIDRFLSSGQGHRLAGAVGSLHPTETAAPG